MNLYKGYGHGWPVSVQPAPSASPVESKAAPELFDVPESFENWRVRKTLSELGRLIGIHEKCRDSFVILPDNSLSPGRLKVEAISCKGGTENIETLFRQIHHYYGVSVENHPAADYNFYVIHVPADILVWYGLDLDEDKSIYAKIIFNLMFVSGVLAKSVVGNLNGNNIFSTEVFNDEISSPLLVWGGIQEAHIRSRFPKTWTMLMQLFLAACLITRPSLGYTAHFSSRVISETYTAIMLGAAKNLENGTGISGMNKAALSLSPEFKLSLLSVDDKLMADALTLVYTQGLDVPLLWDSQPNVEISDVFSRVVELADNNLTGILEKEIKFTGRSQ